MKTPTTYVLGLIAFVMYGCATHGPLTKVPNYEVEITNLGPTVNSTANDFSPTVTANGSALYFTSGRGQEFGRSRFWVSHLERGFWSSPGPLGPPISDGEYSGTPSVSADGQMLYFAAKRENTLGGVDLYSARLEGDSWGHIQNLGPGVNSDGWESQPSISPDGNTLYFVSNRDGGVGGLDIWMSTKDSVGRWLPAINLRDEINTSWDEITPFIAADNMTLYFASNGHPGLQGTDLFVSRRIQGKWGIPENMGAPLNSNENDEFLTLVASGSVMYYSSQRPGGNGGLDLYRAEPNPFPPRAVLVVSGTVKDANSLAPLGVQLQVFDAGSRVLLSTHASNDLTGEYVIVLPVGSMYSIVASQPPYLEDSLLIDLTNLQMYEERNVDFLLYREHAATALEAYVGSNIAATDFSLLEHGRKQSGLLIEEIQAGETVPLLPYVFFDSMKADIPARYVRLNRSQSLNFDISVLKEGITPKYRQILNIIGARMLRYPETALKVTGCLAQDEQSAGTPLALQRAESVKSYLSSVWNVALARITTYAALEPVHPSAGSTNEGMDENRRVELMSADPRLLAPINIRSVERIVSPHMAVFYPKAFSSNGLKHWAFTVLQNRAVLYSQTGETRLPDSLVWDWRNEAGRLPDGNEGLEFKLIVEDMAGGTASSALQRIPVTIATLRKKSEENLPDRTVERIHLILFDFDNSNLNKRTMAMLESLDANITKHSTVTVLGYSDILGESAYNQKLSLERAKSVLGALKKMHPEIPMLAEGVGEANPFLNQELPENRFYSRTVILIIETKKR